MELNFGIKDIIDILLVAFLMYQTYLLLKGTNAVNVFVGILSFVVCWFVVSFVLKMQLLGAILDKIMGVGAIALIVIFKNEIRSFFSMIGSKRKLRFFNWLTKTSGFSSEMENESIKQLVWACRDMARGKCGALIVIEKNADLGHYARTGEFIDAAISSRLIENIFFKNSPLHDGAMIISRRRILSVACILPVSQNQDIPKHLGLRHRAALGVSEKTDAIAIVVSEETGQISLIQDGIVTLDVSAEQLTRALSKDQNIE